MKLLRQNIKSVLIAQLLCLLGLAPQASARTHFVFPDGSGLYPDIQSAIDAAMPLDTVLLAPGTYQGWRNRGLDFNGKNLVLKGDGSREDIIIDCELQDIALHFHNEETLAASVENLTITRGKAPGEPGGGITCESSSPSLRNLIFFDNESTADAGLELFYSIAHVESCLFQSNYANLAAGAMGCYWSSPSLHMVQFLDNSTSMDGGAVYCGPESSPVFQSCSFEDSYADDYGGAVYIISGSTPQFTDCQFIGNQGKWGGAVYCGGAAAEFTGCVFLGNYAEIGGGAFQFNSSPVEGSAALSYSLLYGNNAGSGGGGIIATYGANLTLINVTVVGNYGNDSNGAGVSSFTQSNIVINNSIIALNSGPGLLIGGVANLSVACSDVFGNMGGDYMGNIEDQTGLNGNISEDPLFCDYDNWILTLAEQSPCLPANNDCGVLMGALGMDCTLTGVGEVPGVGVQLLPCFPNPFNPRTTISLELAEPAEIRLVIHDVAGCQIKILHEGWLDAGRRDILWDGLDEDGRETPSGVYFVVLDGATGRSSQKITLLR